MKRPARRSILRMIALLLAWGIAGATLNVAVAWGLAVLGKPEHIGRDVQIAESLFTRYAPAGWMIGPLNGISGTSQGFGVSVSRFSGESALEREWLSVVEWSVGAPMHCLRGGFADSQNRGELSTTMWTVYSKDGSRRTFFPLRPLWPGFAINTLFYAGVLWVLFCGPFALRRMIRRQRGRCPYCSYPIGQSPVCTECGAALTPKAASA